MNAGPTLHIKSRTDSPLAKPSEMPEDKETRYSASEVRGWCPRRIVGYSQLNNGWKSTQKYPSSEGRDIVRVRNNRNHKGKGCGIPSPLSPPGRLCLLLQ